MGLRLQLLFAITFFVNHRASGVADFPSPDDPMLTLRPLPKLSLEKVEKGWKSPAGTLVGFPSASASEPVGTLVVFKCPSLAGFYCPLTLSIVAAQFAATALSQIKTR